MSETNPMAHEFGNNSPAIMPKSVTYNGTTVHFPEEMNLTEMWETSRNSKAQKPPEWINHKGAEFIEALIAGMSSAVPLIRTTMGSNGATFAHWQIGMAYAHHLSSDFAMICNQVVNDFLETKPELAESVIRRTTPSGVASIAATVIDHTHDIEGLAIIRNQAATRRAHLEQGRDLVGHSEPLAQDPLDSILLDCLEALQLKKHRQNNAVGHDEILSVIQPVAEAFQQMTEELGVPFEGNIRQLT